MKYFSFCVGYCHLLLSSNLLQNTSICFLARRYINNVKSVEVFLILCGLLPFIAFIQLTAKYQYLLSGTSLWIYYKHHKACISFFIKQAIFTKMPFVFSYVSVALIFVLAFKIVGYGLNITVVILYSFHNYIHTKPCMTSGKTYCVVVRYHVTIP